MRTSFATVMACSAAVLLTLLAAPLLLRIFGAEFTNALPLVLVLGLAQVARAAATQPQEYLMVAGRAMDVTGANGISVSVMAALALFLAGPLGAAGVAWALTMSLMLRAALLMRHAGGHLARLSAAA